MEACLASSLVFASRQHNFVVLQLYLLPQQLQRRLLGAAGELELQLQPGQLPLYPLDPAVVLCYAGDELPLLVLNDLQRSEPCEGPSFPTRVTHPEQQLRAALTSFGGSPCHSGG